MCGLKAEHLDDVGCGRPRQESPAVDVVPMVADMKYRGVTAILANAYRTGVFLEYYPGAVI